MFKSFACHLPVWRGNKLESLWYAYILCVCMPMGLNRHGYRRGCNLIREPQPEQNAWLPENFFVSRIQFSSVVTENRLLATSLSKEEIITKPTFVLLQLQLSTPLKNLYKTQMCVRRSAYTSPESSTLLKLESIFLAQSKLSLTVFIAKKFDSCRHKYKCCLSWFVFVLGYFICVCHLSVCADV